MNEDHDIYRGSCFNSLVWLIYGILSRFGIAILIAIVLFLIVINVIK